MSEPSAFDLAAPLTAGLTVLEASAGTGKTYALCALAVRHLAEGRSSVGQLCLLSFSEAATTELSGRVRARVAEAADHLERGAPPTRDPVLTLLGQADHEARLLRLQAALRDFDAATITTIHGFCSRVLAASLATDDAAELAGDDDLDEVVHDVLLRRFGQAPPGGTFVPRLRAAVATRLTMPDAHLWAGEAFDGSGLLAGLPAALADDGARVAAAVDEVVAEVTARRRAARRRSFDSLIADARAELRGPRSAGLVAALRERFRLVLIDEFQDTDTVQWDLFRAAFLDGPAPSTVVVVGDPKQAIYRFRGAELSAYLAAAGTAHRRWRLDTNHRSDQPLLDGLAHLLQDTTFGDEAVRFEQVTAPEHHRDAGIVGDDRPPLQLRVVGTDTAELRSPEARRRVIADVVGEVGALLRSNVGVRCDDGSFRTLHPRDVAVLTRSNRDAVRIAQQLGAAGIPAATATANSVLQTRAAEQWRILLAALARPASPGRARAAALGWFLGYQASALAALDDLGSVALHDTLHEWSALLARSGIPQLLAAARARGLYGRLLGRQGGERDLTDLEHVAEVLHRHCGGRPTGAAALLTVLREVAEADDAVAGDQLSRRIDRDDDAVQVLTVHRSKGLEFPVVFCPFLWTRRGNPPATVTHAHVDGLRRIDMLSVARAGKPPRPGDELYERDGAEQDAEALRLLYVALTRARHRVVVWWAPVVPVAGSPLRTVLATATGDAGVNRASLDAWAGRGNGSVEVVPAVPVRVALPSTAAPTDLQAAECRVVLDRAWQRWSFSRLAARAPEEAAPPPAPPAGGLDEGDPDADAASMVPSASLASSTVAAFAAAEGPDLPAGQRFGTLVHRVLERCDFASPTLRDDLLALCTAELSRCGVRADPVVLAEWLAGTLHVPLGGPLGDCRLVDLGRADRLDELWFDMPLGRVHAGAIAEVLHDHLGAGDPFRDWCARLAGTARWPVEGMLNGSVDLVARTDGNYWLADYKTNRLPQGSQYGQVGMVAVMEHHHYPLQATLYLVALHRLLRWRVRGYDPDEHLYGAAYLFLRGMRAAPEGSAAHPGVLWWRPPTEALLALDHLLATGAAA